MNVIDGKQLAATVRQEVAQGVAALVAEGAESPGLATVLVGSDPASEVYVRNKRRLSLEAGMRDLHHWLPENVTQSEAIALIDELAEDQRVSGILIQLPLPPHLDAASLIDRIPTGKDVDGLTVRSAGQLAQRGSGLRPCTPAGVIRILEHVGVEIEGAHAVVVGRSILVGSPMAQLLLERNATVTVCHSRSRDLPRLCREADILIAAAGVPTLLDRSFVKDGAVVVDVGIHRTEHGLVGDVDFSDVSGVASAITPVPGGVGPMTIAMLLVNTLQAAELAHRTSRAG
ncbi:MAG: bifunctional methylenetetrahydrofolate dehydrogenase/methenyltetrahydrofolate cyclohydrolase FolD [Comamonadaceae bacterium]|nr:MAG: bifunctional methylenetetrahydrofolate dehydrogenase/methenyltetrahydrofolate cyclohydrolase FolD [Comamonadaceae bacterium]